MTDMQIAIVAVFWTIAAIPLLMALAVLVLGKAKLVATPIDNRIVRVLSVGGLMGVVMLPYGMGMGLALLFLTGGGWTMLLSIPAATVLVVTGFIAWADATMPEIPEGARAAPVTPRRRELPPNIDLGLRLRHYGTSLRNFAWKACEVLLSVLLFVGFFAVLAILIYLWIRHGGGNRWG